MGSAFWSIRRRSLRSMPPLGFSSSPWQWKQWALRMGRMSRSKVGVREGWGDPASAIVARSDEAMPTTPDMRTARAVDMGAMLGRLGAIDYGELGKGGWRGAVGVR